MYDRVCADGHQMLDRYEKINFDEQVLCVECNKPALRTLLPGRAPGVIGDDIPGGVWIKHGICNEDGTPRKYYSKSEMAAEAKRRGLTNRVEHVANPGSDKSTHTTRWTSTPTEVMKQCQETRSAATSPENSTISSDCNLITPSTTVENSK
jgi:hypothetical protein